MSFFSRLLDNLDSALNQLSAEDDGDAVPLPSPHIGGQPDWPGWDDDGYPEEAREAQGEAEGEEAAAGGGEGPPSSSPLHRPPDPPLEQRLRPAQDDTPPPVPSSSSSPPSPPSPSPAAPSPSLLLRRSEAAAALVPLPPPTPSPVRAAPLPQASPGTSGGLDNSSGRGFGGEGLGSSGSGKAGGLAHPHSFERESLQQQETGGPGGGVVCALCRNLWDDGGSALFPFYRCGKCGLRVHAACRDFAHGALGCPAPPVPDLSTFMDPAHVNCPGVVTVKLRQAYDLPVGPGTSLYVRLGLLPWKERLKTATAEVGVGKQVVWWSELSAPKGSVEPAALTLMHLYNNPATPLPVLRVEVWSSALQGLLDNRVGAVELSMLPLMNHPAVEAERWHRIRPPDASSSSSSTSHPDPSSTTALALDPPPPGGGHGSSSGMILLATSFTPTKAALAAKSMLLTATASATTTTTTGDASTAPGALPGAALDPLAATLSLTATTTTTNGHHPSYHHYHQPPPQQQQAQAQSAPYPSSSSAPVTEHLFQLTSYVLPTFCGVCESLMLGLRRQGFKCELCGLDVHRHCQLKAALHAPCPGAPPPHDHQHQAHHALPQPLAPPSHQQPHYGELGLTGEGAAVMPPLPSTPRGPQPSPRVPAQTDLSTTQQQQQQSQAVVKPAPPLGVKGEEAGIGTLDVAVIRAHHCANRCSSSSSSSSVVAQHSSQVLLDGDYYCRLRLGERTTRRTRTVFQTADPQFDEAFKRLVVPHYRAALVVELIDAARERAVGRVELPVFKLLQRDADALAEGEALRTEEDHVLRDQSDREVGVVRLHVVLVEDSSLFLAGHPRRVPVGPKEELAVENLRRVVERMQAVIATLATLDRGWSYVMQWRQPYLTAALLLLFVYLCLFADAERAGALLVAALLLLLSWLWVERRTGTYRRRWVEMGEAGDEAGGGEGAEGSAGGAGGGGGGERGRGKRPHRALARLRVCVDRVQCPARGLLARGRTVVTASLALQQEQQQGRGSGGGSEAGGSAMGVVGDVEADLLIGCAASSSSSGGGGEGSSSSQAPGQTTWRSGTAALIKELEVEYALPPMAAVQFPRADRGSIFRNVVQYQHHHTTGSPDQHGSSSSIRRRREGSKAGEDEGGSSSMMRYAFLFPLLQPLAEKQQPPAVPASTSGSGKKSSSSKGMVELEALPFSASSACLRVRVYHETGSTLSAFDEDCLGQVLIPVKQLAEAGGVVGGWYSLGGRAGGGATDEPPEGGELAVLVRAQLLLPPELTSTTPQPGGGGGAASVVPSAAQVSESRAFEDMLEDGGADAQAGGQGVVSSLWNLPSTVRAVQNLLEEYLGLVESVKNLLNWTHPRKTAAIYAGLWAALLVLVVVPTRYMVLVGGVYQFFYCFFPEQDEYPNVIRMENLVASVPHDDDLRQRVYRWERQAFLRAKRDRQQSQRQRRAQLTGLWSCLWEGRAQTRASSSQPWRPAYVVVQGSRVLLWRSDRDLDRGAAPDAQLILRGHAGLTSPSPVEMKELGAAKAALLVCVFGKNVAGVQEKRSFLMESQEDQGALTDALVKAMDFKQS